MRFRGLAPTATVVPALRAFGGRVRAIYGSLRTRLTGKVFCQGLTHVLWEIPVASLARWDGGEDAAGERGARSGRWICFPASLPATQGRLAEARLTLGLNTEGRWPSRHRCQPTRQVSISCQSQPLVTTSSRLRTRFATMVQAASSAGLSFSSGLDSP